MPLLPYIIFMLLSDIDADTETDTGTEDVVLLINYTRAAFSCDR